METKFPKSILEESFVVRNHFILNKNTRKIKRIREGDQTRICPPSFVVSSSSTDQPSSSRAVDRRDSMDMFGYNYSFYNYDYIWWLYLCDSNDGYYPVSFYHRYYYYPGSGGGEPGDISVYSGGDVSGGGGTVDGAEIGEDGGAFNTDTPIEIDGGDGGEQNGGFDDGAGHDTFVDGGGGDGDGGDADGE